MIHIEPEDLTILRNILDKFKYTYCAYGSRVKGTHRKFSDLDLCIMEPISDLDMFYLKEALEESNLPFKVDIRRWDEMSKDFQKIIEGDLIKI
jgi:predicted nucleotidyltransferase